MSSEQILQDAEAKMRKAGEVLKREFASMRTGRAHPGIVEHLRVDYHGAVTPLNQLAGISVPEARLLVIQPWDKTSLGAIEKAILKSDLSLNPANDGNVIRLVVPPLTQERREQMVKVVRRRAEEERVAVRNVRRDALEEIRKLKESKEISEDEQKRATNQLQRLTDGFIEEINRITKDKETELLEL